MDTQAYEEGRRHYFNAESAYDNPYERGTDKFNSFERGWSQALRQNPRVAEERERRRGRGERSFQDRRSYATTITPEEDRRLERERFIAARDGY